ncbi:MAG: carboxynorspermidine decarboxylase [Methylococcales bacterium]
MTTAKKPTHASQSFDFQTLKAAVASSPAFVLDAATVVNALQTLDNLRQQSACKLLYSIKALPLSSILNMAKPVVDGFSVSSLFEARLAKEILAGEGSIHLTTPGLRTDEWQQLAQLISHVSFNSIGQYQRFSTIAPPDLSSGLRINPKLSFASDARFNPCRPHSKLGVSIDEFCRITDIENLHGLHFHTVFSETHFEPLLETITKLRKRLKHRFARLQWLNLGGGYLYNDINCQLFIELVRQLKADFALDVYIEPGKAIVGKAGYLVATVLDMFSSDDKTIAVLDTSVNHHPEVFEYQRQPQLLEHDDHGNYAVLLAGCTCLAGDLFGEYRFKQPLNIGDKVTFAHIGAYSLIKANRFNGYNLPDIYLYESAQLKRIKQYTYEDYRQQWFAADLP